MNGFIFLIAWSIILMVILNFIMTCLSFFSSHSFIRETKFILFTIGYIQQLPQTTAERFEWRQIFPYVLYLPPPIRKHIAVRWQTEGRRCRTIFKNDYISCSIATGHLFAGNFCESSDKSGEVERVSTGSFGGVQCVLPSGALAKIFCWMEYKVPCDPS